MEYKEIEITEDKCGDMKNFNHPAFGMIGFNRITSNGSDVLFGSSIKHRNKIMLTIKHGTQTRTFHEDYYSGMKDIIKVEMSYAQFAECISTMNVGNGVPCTITYTEKEGHIPCIKDNTTKREQFRNEFSETITKAMEQVQEQINQIQESLNTKKNLGVKDRQEMIRELQQVKYNIGTNLDFCASQFDEQMDKSTLEAKGEIEAFCQNKINSIAQAALVERKDEFVKLENPVELE